MLVEEKHQNTRGIVHGGMICTLIDLAMCYAPGTPLIRRGAS